MPNGTYTLIHWMNLFSKNKSFHFLFPNSAEPDQALRFEAPDLVLYHLPLSYEKGCQA